MVLKKRSSEKVLLSKFSVSYYYPISLFKISIYVLFIILFISAIQDNGAKEKKQQPDGCLQIFVCNNLFCSGISYCIYCIEI